MKNVRRYHFNLVIHFFYLCLAFYVFQGCASSYPLGYGPDVYGYGENSTLTSSLFESDQNVISQEAVEQILNSKIEIFDSTKLAILKFPDSENFNYRTYGYGYWRNEDFLKVQQSMIDTLDISLRNNAKIDEIVFLPTLLTPKNPSIPILRESAIRLQAPLLLVFRVNGDIYEKYRIFRSSEFKAFSTIEMVLIDIRTGVIPFTTVVTSEYLTNKKRDDQNDQEAKARAINTASFDALLKATDELNVFLNSF